MTPAPSWRKPAGMIGILVYALVWTVLVASFSTTLNGWPWWLQLPVYLVAGLIWIAPLKPVLRWMETGRMR